MFFLYFIKLCERTASYFIQIQWISGSRHLWIAPWYLGFLIPKSPYHKMVHLYPHCYLFYHNIMFFFYFIKMCERTASYFIQNSDLDSCNGYLTVVIYGLPLGFSVQARFELFCPL